MARPERLSTLDLVESLQLAYAVSTLHDLDVFESMPATAEALAKQHRLDATMLRGILEYLAARTDLVRKKGGRFAVTNEYDGGARFLLDVYALAYGANAARLGELMRHPARAHDAVDRKRLARAFDKPQVGALPAIVRQLGFDHVLDLGCGAGALLAALADADPAFVGWGVDRDPAMCRAARSKGVRVFQGDATRPGFLPSGVRKEVQAIVASQLANALPPREIVAWLRRLRKAFPGRPLLLADYYGRLGTARLDRETWLHDYAQLISGQPVPPPDRDAWNALYTAAGCRLVHVMEDPRTSLFVHLMTLPA